MKVPTGRQSVTPSMTSLESDVILVTSQYWKSSHSETRTWINYLYGSFKQTL